MFGKIGDDLGEWMRRRNIYYTLYYDLIDKIRAERSVVADLDRQLHYANRKYDALVNSFHAVTLEGYTISKIQREKGGKRCSFSRKETPLQAESLLTLLSDYMSSKTLFWKNDFERS